MPTILADSFTASLARLANDEQMQAQLTAFTPPTEGRIPVDIVNQFGDKVLSMLGVPHDRK